MGEAKQQCNKCVSSASLAGSEADEQKSYSGKTIPVTHWKYVRSLQTSTNQKKF